MSPLSLASLARRWLVAAVAAAGDGQNILPMNFIDLKISFLIFKNFIIGRRVLESVRLAIIFSNIIIVILLINI
jgi:hypothetical protein